MVAQRIRASMAGEPFVLPDGAAAAGVGVDRRGDAGRFRARARDRGRGAALVAQADQALYQAKEAGRNQVVAA